MAEHLVGTTVGGRYRVTRKLAEGGMGAVFEADDIEGGGRVALKVLHAHLHDDADMVERFRREALAATAIGDAHIVEVRGFDMLDDGSGVYMAMELLEGRDLGRLIKDEGPLPVGRVVHIARQIARALSAAHAKGIVHRDLKPENVFLVERAGDPDFVKLLDFGISKLQQVIDGVEEVNPTKTGTTLGTPHYMAPEQAQAQKDVDHRVDVYALGVILFRALTGQHPFDDASYPMLVLKICTDPPPPVRRYRGDVPVPLEAAILRMLAKDRAKRFQSAADVDEALGPFADHDGPVELLSGPSTRENRARALTAAGHVSTPEALARTHAVTEADGASADRAHEDDPPPPPPGGSGVLAKAMLGGMALVLLALVAWAVAGALEDDDVPDAEAFPELPEPRAPSERPMVPSGSGVGWTWVNPQPRAMPSWYGVAAAAGGDPVVMVGRDGLAVRYESGSIFLWRTGASEDLRGVAWTGAHEALAAGEDGTLVRLRSGGPQPIDSGVEGTLRGVSALSATEAIVVGDGGTVLRVIGERVTRLEVATRADLLSVFSRGEQTFVAGAEGTVLRIEGRGGASETVPVQVTLRGIGGCADGSVYAVGDEGVVLRRLRDGSWRQLRVEGTEAFTGVSCDHGRVAAVRRDGEIRLLSGDRSVVLPSGFDRAWYGVSGGREGPTWVVGAGGRLASIEEDHVRTRTAGPTVPIRDLGAMGGALVAVGEWGRILRQTETGFAQVESPTEAGLAAALQMTEGRLLALGDSGAVVAIRYDRATLLPTPQRQSLRDGVTDGQTLLLVGVEGTVLRGLPESLTASRIPDVGDLWSATGTPGDALVVGDGGVVLHFGANGFARRSCDVEATLRAVHRDAQGAWAAGDDGLIVRLEEDGCVREREGGPTLHAIGRGPEGQLLAAGDDGVVLQRGEDGWTRVGVDVSGHSIRAIWRSDRYVYLAGTGGVLVRHIRVDGT